MKYRAVLFDLDGTLVDTLQDIADSTNQALSQFGFPGHDKEAYRYFVGEGRDVLAFRALPEAHRDSEMVSKLVAVINEEYSRRWADCTHPYDGVPEMLDGLTARNIRMAVLSNKATNFTEMTVNSLLSRWRFDAVVGASPSQPNKPDPTSALQIARQLGIDPAGFLYLGDSAIDMQTATSAGMYPVGAVWGFRGREELLEGGAKTLIERPPELLNLL
jgi:phosphoglycolate phosphatase